MDSLGWYSIFLKVYLENKLDPLRLLKPPKIVDNRTVKRNWQKSLIYCQLNIFFILIDDPNAEPTEATVSNVCEICNLRHLIKDKKCYRNPTEPTCID